MPTLDGGDGIHLAQRGGASDADHRVVLTCNDGRRDDRIRTCDPLTPRDWQHGRVRSPTQVNDGYRVRHRLAGGARLLYFVAVPVPGGPPTSMSCRTAYGPMPPRTPKSVGVAVRLRCHRRIRACKSRDLRTGDDRAWLVRCWPGLLPDHPSA
jgi:hypothetical protein